MGILLVLVCLLFGCQPVRAQEGSTAITVTVPEQPKEEIKAAAGAEMLDDVPLPKGWEWKDGSLSLKPGGSVTGIAVYRDGDGNILAERQVTVTAPEKENTKYEPLPGGGRDWNGDKDTGITIKVPEEVGKIIEVTVDGKELSGDDYTVTGNPPVVTLKPEFLKTLGDGTHTILIQGENGYVETTFTVKKAETETDKKTDTTEKASGAGQSTGAKTGDETDVASWTTVLLLSLAILLAAGIRQQRKAKRQQRSL